MSFRRHHSKKPASPVARFLVSAGVGILLGLFFVSVVKYALPQNQLRGTPIANNAGNVANVPNSSTGTKPSTATTTRKTRAPTPQPTMSPTITQLPPGKQWFNWQCRRDPELVVVGVPAEDPLSLSVDNIANTPFYMYEHPTLDTRPLLSCVIQLAGLGQDHKDGCTDCYVSVDELANNPNLDPSFTKILNDLLILENLRYHPSRTTNPEEALIFVLDFVPSLLNAFPFRFDELKCDTSSFPFLNRNEWIGDVLEFLRNTKYFSSNKGRDHLFISSTPLVTDAYQKTITAPVMKLFKKGPIILANTDPAGTAKKAKRVNLGAQQSTSFVIPLLQNQVVLDWRKTQPQFDSTSDGGDSLLRAFTNREYNFYLDHAPYPSNWRRLVSLLSTVYSNDGRSSGIPMVFNRATQNALMRTSARFCILEATGYEYGKLYNALAAGCIPVVIAEGPFLQLPFQKRLNWRKIAFFVQNAKCFAMDTLEHSASTLEMLPKMLESELGQEKIKSMLLHGAKAFEAMKFIDKLPNYHKNQVIRTHRFNPVQVQVPTEPPTTHVNPEELTEPASNQFDQVDDNGARRRLQETPAEASSSSEDPVASTETESFPDAENVHVAHDASIDGELEDTEDDGEEVDAVAIHAVDAPPPSETAVDAILDSEAAKVVAKVVETMNGLGATVGAFVLDHVKMDEFVR